MQVCDSVDTSDLAGKAKALVPAKEIKKPERTDVWTHLEEERAREILAEKHFAHLGCVLEDGAPYVVPVNYLLRDDSIYIHSLEGLKTRALRKNGKACLQVEDVRSPFSWKSAIAFGTFEEIDDPELRSEALEELMKHFSALTPVEGMEADRPAEELVVFRIRIDRVSGAAEN